MARKALVSSLFGRSSAAKGLSLLTLGASLTATLPAFAQGTDEPPIATAEANDEPAVEAPASAESEKAAPAEESSDESASKAKAKEDFGHFGQFGLRAGLVAGYRMIFRYEDSPFCREPEDAPLKPAKDQSVVCGHAAPLAMDVALSFALLDSLELFGFGRFGLTAEEQTDTEAVRAFGVGARLYSMSDDKLKIFVQPAVGMSFEGAGDNALWQAYPNFEPSYKSDLLFQLSVGPQYDFNRYFGLYASGGLTVGVLRALSANLEGTIGLQGRAP